MRRFFVAIGVLAIALLVGAGTVLAAHDEKPNASPNAGYPVLLIGGELLPPGLAQHSAERGVLPPGFEKKESDWTAPGHPKKDLDRGPNRIPPVWTP